MDTYDFVQRDEASLARILEVLADTDWARAATEMREWVRSNESLHRRLLKAKVPLQQTGVHVTFHGARSEQRAMPKRTVRKTVAFGMQAHHGAGAHAKRSPKGRSAPPGT